VEAAKSIKSVVWIENGKSLMNQAIDRVISDKLASKGIETA
jgi:hypothetical protein